MEEKQIFQEKEEEKVRVEEDQKDDIFSEKRTNQNMKYRAVFVSDFHLGANKAQVNQINKFLKTVDCETLYLVGDILDIWRIKQLLRMGKKSKKHFVCINKILRIASRNTKVVYVLGNHDEFLNVFASNFKSDNLEVCNMTTHKTTRGDKILIAHGHQFDLASRFPKTLLVLGDCMYDFLLFSNRIVNLVRGILGKPHWSLSQYLKKNVKKAINFLETYEKVAVETARKKECSAVVCGHVHTPARKNINGIEYLNTGCWTEERNCSYIVEHWNGELEIKEFFLGDIAQIDTNTENAHFWLKRRGGEKEIGRPMNEFDKEHIGIRVKDEHMG